MRKQTVWCQMSNLQGKNEWCNRAARVEVVTFEGRRLKVCEEHRKRLTERLSLRSILDKYTIVI